MKKLIILFMMFTLKTSYAALNMGEHASHQRHEGPDTEICGTISVSKRTLRLNHIMNIVGQIKVADRLNLNLHYVDYQKRLGFILDALVKYPKVLMVLDLKLNLPQYDKNNIITLCAFLKKSELLSFKLEIQGATKDQINAIIKDGSHISQSKISVIAENNATIIHLTRDIAKPA